MIIRDAIKRFYSSLLRLKEKQQAIAGLNLPDKGRLILQILAENEANGADGLSIGEVAAHYQDKTKAKLPFDDESFSGTEIPPIDLTASNSTVSAMLNTLWDDHYIQKSILPSAPKFTTIQITDRGRDYLKRMKEAEDARGLLYEKGIKSEDQRCHIADWFDEIERLMNEEISSK